MPCRKATPTAVTTADTRLKRPIAARTQATVVTATTTWRVSGAR
jgi:hypothetical protein